MAISVVAILIYIQQNLSLQFYYFRLSLKFRKSVLSGAAKLRKEEKEPQKVTSCLCWLRFFLLFLSLSLPLFSEAPCSAPRCVRVHTEHLFNEAIWM